MYSFRFFLLATMLYTVTSCDAQQPASLKQILSLKGKMYHNDSLPQLLKKYQFIESSQVSPIGDPEQFTVYVYRHNKDYIVFFTLKEADSNEVIQDIISITVVKQSEQVKTVLCWEGTVNNVELVALINPGEELHSKALKVWRFSRDKRRFEVHNPKNVSCLNEGYSPE